MTKLKGFLAAAVMLASIPLAAETLPDIKNYREYSPRFASAGQPSREQLQLLKEVGFERIVYIAFAADRKNKPRL